MKRGQRTLIPAPGTTEHCHLFGALNWHTGNVDWLSSPHKNSDAFVTFLEHLALTVYPGQRLVLVLDNASYHKSRTATAALAALDDRVLVVWLPKYSPFLNPIERFWLHLKSLAHANHLHPDLNTLIHSVAEAIANQNTPGHPQRLNLVDNLRPVA